MSKKIIWIKAEQIVSCAIGLEIGKEISEQEAEKLLKLDGDTYHEGDDEWYKLHEYLTPDTIYDWQDWDNVEVYTEDV